MGRKRKLMTSASRRGEGVCSVSESESMIDVFSKLPDQISHHILCLLAVTDLARFGCVSKRCRELCLSSPKLNFDEFSLVNTSTCYKRLKLFTYLDRFFFHRGGDKIQSFRIRWYRHDVREGNDEEAPCLCDCCASFRMFTWIENAVRCNVEVLDLAMNLYHDEEERFPFPASVFLCETLRHLVLHLNSTVLKTPSFAFQSHLKILELKNVDIDDGGGFFKWISCCCKFIEELSLEHVSVTQEFTVESSALKKLNCSGIFLIDKCHINISCDKLEYVRICWVFDSPRNKSFSMFAPNLKSFKWFGSLMNHSNLGKLERLEAAALFLEPTMNTLDNIFEVLQSLCRAKLLMLNEATIKALPLREGSRPAPLCDTSSLCIEIRSFVDELIPPMVSLFIAMPKLCTLCIMLNPPSDDPNSNASGISMEYWKLQNPAFVYQLKQATIELCCGSNGIELARYIIEYAQNLQKMVIIYSSQDLEKVTREIEKSKMISNATIDFQEKSIKG